MLVTLFFFFLSASFRREYLNVYESDDDNDISLSEATEMRINIKIDMKIELLKRKSSD